MTVRGVCHERVQFPRRVKRILPTFVVGVSLLGMCTRLAAQTRLPIAPEPVGSGARALAQSAFIAVADDATAASWNPAGLINLEKPEASFVGVWRTMETEFSSAALEGDRWSEWEANFASYAQPLQIGNTDVVLSVNYHQAYDLGLEHRNENGTVRSRGAIGAYSLACGLSLPSSSHLTIGASFNWYDRSVCNDYVRQVNKPASEQIFIETLDSLRGHNFTLGFLWDAYEREENLLTLGLVCHTPFTADVDGKLVTQSIGEDNQGTTIQPVGPLHIDFPPSLGAGLNYRFSDRFSGAFDVQYTDWSKHTYTGATSSPSDIVAYRLGFESLKFSPGGREWVRALRGGIFYEPRPAWGDTLPVWGFSLGLGWTVKERFSLDFAYQFRWGDEDNLRVDPATRIDYGIEEHWLIGSVITYF